jgi:hypothetical protein
MPMILYTEQEHEAAVEAANARSIRLARALCEAKDFLCILGPEGRLDGPGEYCDGCPADKDCPARFKRYAP